MSHVCGPRTPRVQVGPFTPCRRCPAAMAIPPGGQHGDREMCAMRPAWVDETLFPFESHYAQINGAQVHYIDEGRGPVFLGLHGNPTWPFVDRHIVPELKD